MVPANLLWGLPALAEAKYTSGASQFVFVDAFPITKGSPLENPVRAIRCGIGGTLVVRFEGGTVDRTVRFLDGQERLMRVTEVKSGTADQIEGLV